MTHSTLLTEDPVEAAGYIRSGQVAAFPTETVYGLGGDVFVEDAIRAIFAAKERPADNPLIAHIAKLDQIEQLATTIPPAAQQLIDAFFPGPLTVILPRRSEVPEIVSAGLDSIAVRMPAHPIAHAFLEACDTPVAAPSANRSGRPSPTDWQDVYADLKGRIPCILKGGFSEVGLESTVVDCTVDPPQVLRTGAIGLEALQEVVPTIGVGLKTSGVVKSPGMKYRHYAPNAKVLMIADVEEAPAEFYAAYIGITPHPYLEQFGMHLACEDLSVYAHELFRFFRRCDRGGINVIYCESPGDRGLGPALRDRIEKASQGSSTS